MYLYQGISVSAGEKYACNNYCCTLLIAKVICHNIKITCLCSRKLQKYTVSFENNEKLNLRLKDTLIVYQFKEYQDK